MCTGQPARPVWAAWSLCCSLRPPAHPPQAQLIAQSIGQAFSVAYQEFLRANGINPEDLSQKEYSDVINTQEMYNDDLIHFSNSENCKEVSCAPGGGHGKPPACLCSPNRAAPYIPQLGSQAQDLGASLHGSLAQNTVPQQTEALPKRASCFCTGSRALVCEMSWCCNKEADYSRS